MKSGSEFGENDFGLGVICTDSPGTKVSYPVFQWGSYWHVVKNATPKRLPLYTIFCMAELADLVHGAHFAGRLWTSYGTVLMSCANQNQTARIPAAFRRQFRGE